ncbi:hypothetical protein ACIRBX_17070 [Kitasatospora sp. NPDC096147]|uniref:hypothetical protein n=1 Tax=Kitasatospora sp. NPDC096147 TaxID=3364093 RepID=UPI00382FD61A
MRNPSPRTARTAPLAAALAATLTLPAVQSVRAATPAAVLAGTSDRTCEGPLRR